MNVKPFRGLRPRADLAAKVPSLPYDVLDSNEARELARGDPYTFLHVVKAEIDLDPTIRWNDERVYSKARENFLAMREKGWLVRDARRAFYLYRQRLGDHVQTGVVGAVSVSDYTEGRVKKHENTRPEKEDDRVHHANAIGAHAGPVFLAYRESPAIEELTGRATRRPPATEFVAADGVGHALWVVDAPEEVAQIEAALGEVPESYIADGHHRAAAYARVAMMRREPLARFLAVHFPKDQLRILGYNRLVRDLNGLEPPAFLRRIDGAGFDLIDPWPDGRPREEGTFAMYLDGVWRLLVARPGLVPASDPVRRLDVSVLQERILGPILGVGDPRTDARIAFCGGIRGVAELTRRVDGGEHRLAFAMHPTSLEDVMRVADAGEVMPPKSTWFEPKLRSGMVVHLFDEA